MLRPCFDPPANFRSGWGWAVAEFAGAFSDPTPMSGVANAAAENTPNSRRDRAPLSLSMSIRISGYEKEWGRRKNYRRLPASSVTLSYVRRVVNHATTTESNCEPSTTVLLRFDVRHEAARTTRYLVIPQVRCERSIFVCH